MAKYIVKSNQNIFDISLQLYGTVEGVFDLLITNKWLNMNTDLNTGDELEYHEGYLLNQSVVTNLKKEGVIPSNGERHVYHKQPTEELLAVCDISELLTMTSFVIGGEGVMIVDWGDNTPLEHIQLTHSNHTVVHYFDNIVERRRIKFYGNTKTMKLTVWDTTEIGGSLLMTHPVVVDEYISHTNGFNLSGLFLFEGTYFVDLCRCTISSLLPLGNMDLQELDLTDVHFTSVSVLDEYLQYIVTNYGTRRGCIVHLTTEPSSTGWQAIRTILGEQEWNTPMPWKFIINGVTYTYSA